MVLPSGRRGRLEAKAKSLSLPSAKARCRISTHLGERGTRCSRPAFIRAAGTVHIARSRSNSAFLAPITSPVRAAVRIKILEGELNRFARTAIRPGPNKVRDINIGQSRVVLVPLYRPWQALLHS